MDTAHINKTTLRNLLKLTEKRDALREELKKVESAIGSTLSGRTSESAETKAAPKTRRKKRRGRKTAAAKASTASAAPKAPKATKTAKKTSTRKTGGKRGALKSRVLSALRKAGSSGISVKELSKKLGVKSQNIHVWFSSTGKNLSEVEKVSPGVYRYNG